MSLHLFGAVQFHCCLVIRKYISLDDSENYLADLWFCTMVSNLLGLKKEKEKEKTKAVTISPQYSVLFFLEEKNHSVACHDLFLLLEFQSIYQYNQL